ncbi:MAG TPA: guanine deaminase [Xanthobacteraceae bacterium]|jgi:guanine deaminase
MTDVRGRVLAGTFFHAPVRGTIEILEDALLALDESGTIAAVTRSSDPDHAHLRAEAAAAGRLFTISSGSYVLPGLIDLHIHAPQYPQLGKALDRSLEDWLARCTFPLEARYADLAFARRAYEALIDDLAANGTTTAVMYGTIHESANKLLVDICRGRGLRAFIGKVAMDNPETCPYSYRDASPDAALRGTQALIEYIGQGGAGGLIRPVVTPRFIPSCTDATLAGLAEIGRVYGCHIQTHCSESDWQHAYAFARFGRSDAESLDRFGLLSRHSILAHAPLLSDGDMGLVCERGSGIAHCPLSNVYFSNAVFPLKAALDKGLRVGLGTDISGGPNISLLDSVRMSVAGSRLLEEGVDPALPAENRGRKGSRIDWRTGFFLATAGGADVLDIPVGRFAPGNKLDAIVVDTQTDEGSIRIFEEIDSLEDVLSKILHTACRRNIVDVLVAGRALLARSSSGPGKD